MRSTRHISRRYRVCCHFNILYFASSRSLSALRLFAFNSPMQRMLGRIQSLNTQLLVHQLARQSAEASTFSRSLSRAAGRHRHRHQYSANSRTHRFHGAVVAAVCQRNRTNNRHQWALALVPLGLGVVRLDAAEKDSGKEIASRPEDLEVTHHDENDFGSDEDAGFFKHLWATLNRYLFEPLGTSRRFLYLAFLFLPVIFTAPILALEWMDSAGKASINRHYRRKGERATTRWWYRFLVKQMERAGPTFIKVTWQFLLRTRTCILTFFFRS